MHTGAASLAVCFLALGCASSPPGDPSAGLGVETTARLDSLRPELEHPDPVRRRATARALGAVGEPGLALLLAGLEGEGDPAVRDAYVRAIAGIEVPQAASALARVAGDRNEAVGVRLGAVQGLSRIGDATALVALARATGPVGRAARLGLSIRGGEQARAFFLHALEKLRLTMQDRRDVVGGLCRLATAAERPVLRRLASDRDAVARRLAVNALGRMGTADDRRLVARLARSDRDRGVRRAAAIALYRLDSR